MLIDRTAYHIPALCQISEATGSEIGMELMLEAMSRTRKMGKKFSTLAYLSEDKGGDSRLLEAREIFFGSFSERFKIPMISDPPEKGEDHEFTYLKYDLTDVDISALCI